MQPGRNLTIEMLTSLRLMCIELLHVLMVWEPFRTLQEPVSDACRGGEEGRYDRLFGLAKQIHGG